MQNFWGIYNPYARYEVEHAGESEREKGRRKETDERGRESERGRWGGARAREREREIAGSLSRVLPLSL